MNIFTEFKNKVVQVLKDLAGAGILPAELDYSAVTAEPPRDPSHGDIATNAAMVLCKKADMKPRDLATKIADGLATFDEVENVEVAGPGFINIRVSSTMWLEVLLYIAGQRRSYGDIDIGQGEKINVEYVSANPTGPMHIGHARGAVYGDALCLLLRKAGFDVTKEFYINDAGAQVDVLARSAFLRYKQALGYEIEIPEGLYPGDYLKPVGQALKGKYGDSLLSESEESYFAEMKSFVLEQMMQLIKDDLAVMGIRHDVFTSEKSLHDEKMIDKSLELLQSKGLVYQGVLEPPKGKKPDDWQEREQLLFKATDFGDDVDRAIKKSDDSWTYFAADMAYHYDKFKRGFNKMVLILGADHGGYVKRIKSVVKAMTDGKAEVDVKIAQLVNFLDAGVSVKMSKRAGNFTTVRDVVDEVGSDVVRFIMLTRKNDAVLDFDLEAVKLQSKDNPVFYVQYAHARCCSVLRNAKDECPEAVVRLLEVDAQMLKNIESSDELEIIKLMASWPRVVESAAKAYEPHRVAFYLQELAAGFHSLWNKGKSDAILRFIVADNAELTAARLVMIRSLADVLASGLSVLGIEAVEEMR